MPAIQIKPTLTTEDKWNLMQEDARHEVVSEEEAASRLAEVKASVKAKPGPPKAPKVFLANDCVFNCAYCGCRSGNDGKRCYCTEPRELAQLAVSEAYRLKQGVFITSAIFRNADYTEELIIETLRIIRQELLFKGYVHAKVMPGTDPELIRRAGLLANRLSVNIEVAKSEGYAKIAKNKNKKNILTPMKQIRDMIRAENEGSKRYSSGFATSQSTQLMAGSTDEDDFTILRLADALYRSYSMKRVYYTAFEYRDPAAGYEALEAVKVPKWRMRRLYQADRLMQLYGFAPEEIAPQEDPNLYEELDPKAAWALRNLHLFPVEANTADYEMLIRVPGIGSTYASRIVKARRYCSLTFDSLKALGVSTKRCRHFMTCGGKFIGDRSGDPTMLHGLLADPVDSLSDGQLIMSGPRITIGNPAPGPVFFYSKRK